jgi:hypothetical protein
MIEIDSLIKAVEQKISLVSASITATDIKFKDLDQAINLANATANATDLALKAVDAKLSKSISAVEEALKVLDNKMKNEMMSDSMKHIDDQFKKLPGKIDYEIKD